MDSSQQGRRYSTTAMLLAICLSIVIGVKYTHVAEGLKYQVDEPDWNTQQPVVSMNPTNNTCQILQPISFTFFVNYRFEREAPDSTTIGKWSGSTRELFIYDMDEWKSVNTISHEVSHLVDTIMEENPTLHHHYEAYLQGDITECVYELSKLAYSKTGAE